MKSETVCDPVQEEVKVEDALRKTKFSHLSAMIDHVQIEPIAECNIGARLTRSGLNLDAYFKLDIPRSVLKMLLIGGTGVPIAIFFGFFK